MGELLLDHNKPHSTGDSDTLETGVKVWPLDSLPGVEIATDDLPDDVLAALDEAEQDPEMKPFNSSI